MSIRKQDFKKINDYLWELPVTYNHEMRVPVRVYADDELLEDALGDASMQQAVNVACLPTLIGHVVVMPDVHQGYGMPIGGVMAAPLPSGIISPGSVGYDINCLTGDSLVLHHLGYHRRIGDMAIDWQQARLAAQDSAANRRVESGIMNYLRMRPKASVLKVTTESGDQIHATADHPFWTPDGMVELGRLKSGDRVAVYPFMGVTYEKPASDVIVSREEVERLLRKLGKDMRGHGIEQIINQLLKRDLLPLRFDSPQLPVLIKLVGMSFGDGSINFVGREGQGQVAFYGRSEDLEEIRRDIRALNFGAEIYSRQRNHKILTTYAQYEFQYTEAVVQVGSSAFAVLLAALGAPIGNKATQIYSLPGWLFAAPLWQKRLFVAAFFGAEMSAPNTITGHGYNFYPPTVSLNKREDWIESGHTFLKDIAGLLSDFGIETNAIGQRREQRNKDGSTSYRLRLSVSSRPEQLIRLWTIIGFEYNRKRSALANVGVQYLKHKQNILGMRQSIAERAATMAGAGQPLGVIVDELAGPMANYRFIERSIYGGRRTPPRVGEEFQTFAAFRAQVTDGLGESGMVWERILSIQQVDHDGDVFDFTIDHPDHNFIANGFVVSNCGVRLLASRIQFEAAEAYVPDLATVLYKNCPSGVGGKGSVPVTISELDRVCREGARWALKEGFARQQDLARTEEFGCIDGADSNEVSSRAKERGKSQLGTLGAGNHFIEVDVVDQVFDAEAASILGLAEGRLAVQIHCGSRGFGHQVCTDYVQEFQGAVKRYGIHLPDRELVCAPLDSPEGKRYLAAMKAAANFAFCNRQVLAHHIRRSFEQVLAGKVKDWDLHQVYDIAHNMGKIETHQVGGESVRACVHRKGATRAFGPGFEGLPPEYKPIGQPVLVPGSMGTASWVLLGTEGSMAQSFGSTCHGAGRVMSRAQAKREIRGDALRQKLESEGISVRAGSMPGLAEEAPAAYKDVDQVIEVVSKAGIAKKVARLRPVAVVKG